MDKYPCPICNVEHNTLARYFNCVCNDCLAKYGTKDKNGTEKLFGNESPMGGIIAVCNNKPTTDYSCFVNNVECYADEARFGGIVIRPIKRNMHSA